MNNYEGIIAIDLGTTNCVASVIKEDGEMEVIHNHLGEDITPSFIYIGEDKNILVGKPAIEKIATEPDRVFHSYKPLMSTRRELSDNIPNITPEFCSTCMLSYLKTCAEKQINKPITKAVITVPAYFEEKQKNATMGSAVNTGLEVIMLPTEPTSASYYFSNNVSERLPLTVLVYDLGGGTFDTCIQKIFSLKEVEVQAISGDKNLGGDDVNLAIAKYVAGNNFDNLDFSTRTQLIKESTEAKIFLSDTYHKGSTNEVYKFSVIQANLTTSEFLSILNPIITKTVSILEKMLRESKISVSTIDEVLLVGGSTRLPLIREMLIDLLDDDRFQQSYFEKYMSNPDLAVGFGANRLIKEVVDYGDDVINNILPIPIKIVMDNNELDTIFPKNAMLPTKKTVYYSNTDSGQDDITLQIVESFKDFYEDESNTLGRVTVNLPRTTKRAGEFKIKVILRLDSAGLLSVKYSLLDGTEEIITRKTLPIKRHQEEPKQSNTLNTSFGGK